MQVMESNINTLLELNSKIRRLVMSRGAVRSLHEVSWLEWNRSFNSLNGTHLIKDLVSSTTKSEAIRGYVSRLVKVQMNTVGILGNAWTKDSIVADHTAGLMAVGKLSSTVYKNNKELFVDTASRVLGFDPDVVRFSIAESKEEEAFYLVKHLVCHLDLVGFETRELIKEENNEEDFVWKFEQAIKKEFIAEIDFFANFLNEKELDEAFFTAINKSIVMDGVVNSVIFEPDNLALYLDVVNNLK